LIKRILIFAILTYKKVASPLLKGSCRFYPSCSDYSVAAIEKFGPFMGIGMALMRILRCNGYFKGGYDPVERENVSRETFWLRGAAQK
jgi:putative membrane protein insertion efficiency factor